MEIKDRNSGYYDTQNKEIRYIPNIINWTMSGELIQHLTNAT